MARIPDEEIKRLKREVSIQRLAEARGVQLKRSGKELIGLCPFHKDTNPSLNIDPATPTIAIIRLKKPTRWEQQLPATSKRP